MAQHFSESELTDIRAQFDQVRSSRPSSNIHLYARTENTCSFGHDRMFVLGDDLMDRQCLFAGRSMTVSVGSFFSP